MRLGVLFSGGKDSTLALHRAKEKETIVCLITLTSKNKESYMFHTPNIEMTTLQAEALELPLVSTSTEGKKETELIDLECALSEAKEQFNIEGIVTGTVESTYQTTRIQRICDKLNLCQFNPLWKYNQKALLEELIAKKFQVIISGVFAYPLDKTWLGKQIDTSRIAQLVELQNKYGINPAGEGGEIETTVLDAPLFKQKIEITEATTEWQGSSGTYHIKTARLTPK
ncbi:diphthine--ammonia ligase [Candidatus Bathycorpusculum sp.]|jgi:ABC transporter with metal-binding/Fe-S-binding domain ATP-binding protein|uniref:diphthine--ammonia ligase n=1 Tax=Candidatus Bathycorpusculum sp. TaxID=2994959 RepID=UPI00282DF271|nr:TIGR00289 family protein [Candidatus Termitimicrobium sp.]MCL2686060.1 TIGR00289 family protein [Candidatus Termitimicrobium sp.]